MMATGPNPLTLRSEGLILLLNSSELKYRTADGNLLMAQESDILQDVTSTLQLRAGERIFNWCLGS